jgi:hypothetical protein
MEVKFMVYVLYIWHTLTLGDIQCYKYFYTLDESRIWENKHKEDESITITKILNLIGE